YTGFGSIISGVGGVQRQSRASGTSLVAGLLRLPRNDDPIEPAPFPSAEPAREPLRCPKRTGRRPASAPDFFDPAGGGFCPDIGAWRSSWARSLPVAHRTGSPRSATRRPCPISR